MLAQQHKFRGLNAADILAALLDQRLQGNRRAHIQQHHPVHIGGITGGKHAENHVGIVILEQAGDGAAFCFGQVRKLAVAGNAVSAGGVDRAILCVEYGHKFVPVGHAHTGARAAQPLHRPL